MLLCAMPRCTSGPRHLKQGLHGLDQTKARAVTDTGFYAVQCHAISYMLTLLCGRRLCMPSPALLHI